MEGRIARTLDTLHEALEAAYAVRDGALEREERACAAREEAAIVHLEERIAHLEGTGQRWTGRPGRRAGHLPGSCPSGLV